MSAEDVIELIGNEKLTKGFMPVSVSDDTLKNKKAENKPLLILVGREVSKDNWVKTYLAFTDTDVSYYSGEKMPVEEVEKIGDAYRLKMLELHPELELDVLRSQHLSITRRLMEINANKKCFNLLDDPKANKLRELSNETAQRIKELEDLQRGHSLQ